MPGRINWTRAAQESRIAHYGAEPLAPEDRTILGGKPRLDLKKARPPKHRPPRKRKLWEPLEGASPAKAAQIAARLDAAAARARRKKEQAEARPRPRRPHARRGSRPHAPAPRHGWPP